MPHLSFCLILPCFYRANCFLPLTRSFHSGDMPRKYSTTSGTASRMRSISSSVFHSHRLRRSEPCATSCGRPMASSTWLGSSEPDVHALPDDAQMPFASRRSSRLSPSTPSKQKLTLPGKRFTGSPLSALCGILDRPSIRRSRRALTLFAFSSRCAQASSRAAAMPMMAGMFSVPARRPR